MSNAYRVYPLPRNCYGLRRQIARFGGVQRNLSHHRPVPKNADLHTGKDNLDE